jgi:hypothetical protein
VIVEPPTASTTGLIVHPSSPIEDSITSSVATIFYAEFPSPYAEKVVEFSDSQLYFQCQGNLTWIGADDKVLGTDVQAVTTTLDNDGNAFVVAIAGPSCASGGSTAEVDLVGPPYTTLTHSFVIRAPEANFFIKP